MTINAIRRTLNATDSNGMARAWVIYYDDKDKIKEIKSIFNPLKYKGSRPLLTDDEIIDKLIKEKKQNIRER